MRACADCRSGANVENLASINSISRGATIRIFAKRHFGFQNTFCVNMALILQVLADLMLKLSAVPLESAASVANVLGSKSGQTVFGIKYAKSFSTISADTRLSKF